MSRGLIQLHTPIHLEAIAQDTDVFSTLGAGRLVLKETGTVRITVCASADSAFGVRVWQQGGVNPTGRMDFNTGNPVGAGQLNTFVFSGSRGEELDFQFGAAVTINRLLVELAKGGIA